MTSNQKTEFIKTHLRVGAHFCTPSGVPWVVYRLNALTFEAGAEGAVIHLDFAYDSFYDGVAEGFYEPKARGALRDFWRTEAQKGARRK